MITPTLLTLLLASASTVAATISYNSTLTHPGDHEPWFSGSIPSSALSASCGSAYAQDLPCDEWLLKAFDQSSGEGDKFSNATLNALCTDTCILGLQKWRDDVRKSCTASDAGRGSTVGQQAIRALLDTKQMFVQYLYWPTCMRDLKTGTLCYANKTNSDVTASSDDGENTPEIISDFCANNCQTQASVLTWVVSQSMYNDTNDINIADARKVCNKLDTSAYPFLKDVSAGGSSSSSSSSGAGGGAAGNSTTGTGSGRGNGTAGAGVRNAGVKAVGGNIGLLASAALAAMLVAFGSL
ncbi:hypothetical protein L873DRAFT_1803930 [Choiromyces venosus 120613-1]|uniref:Uncharacterized protein n=1 Tax=Choiromyces venosus 120613-1 TaxID=1336337 RepID=A0A3N4JZ02_9PEZI|nr:hypothetical protein L873DRAFT_1803930 [Choiromyces venosus 120613-1]